MLVKIMIDGQLWMELEVKDTLAPDVMKQLQSVYQTIINGKDKSSVMTKAVHQLRKKYG